MIENKIVFLFLLSLLALPATPQSFEWAESFENVCELQDVNGVTVADYDLDGDLDIFIVSVHRFEEGDSQTWSRLLQNNGAPGFRDVTAESNLLAANESLRNGWMGDRMAASWGDYDNDGYPDLFLANNGGDELWHNEGNGQFINVTATAGVRGCLDCYSSNGLWWDYDLDGDLDLYVSDWLKANCLYRNEGDGTFTNQSSSSGLNDPAKTWASLPFDVNGDFYPDLYVVNDFGYNHLFLNDGNGAFQLATKEYGLEDEGDGMGVDICDFNNDGNFDIYVTNIFEHHPNPFFVGKADGTFSDLANRLGIDDTGWGWGARFFDADHDLDEDLYVVNGVSLSAGRGDRNVFFENRAGKFYSMGDSLGIDSPVEARGLEVFDYDLDGDLDMLVGNRSAHSHLYKNSLMETASAGHNWIQIVLEGTTSNKNGWGAVVEINCEGQYFYRYHSGTNLFGQSVKPLHFGLAAYPKASEIAVTWPGGKKEYFPGAGANQFLTLKEGQGQAETSWLMESAEDSIPARFTIFPNPFHDQLAIHLEDKVSGQIAFTLFSVAGQSVFHDKQLLDEAWQVEITLSPKVSTLRPGLYFYSLETPNDTFSGKIRKR